MVKPVLFILPYPLRRAPSQRFRVEAYFNVLRENGIDFDTHVFLDEAAWDILYKKGSLLQKGWAVLKGFFNRFVFVFLRSWKYDYVFIHREGSPLGPPILEFWLSKILRKKLIFDFDDAIWIPNTTESNKLAAALKCFWKIKYIVKWSYKVSAGNAFLARWAQQYNTNVVLNPTCVDMQSKHNRIKNQHAELPVIGWTGSHSTLKYLDAIVPVLQELEKIYDFNFLVICNQQPAFSLKNLQFLPWKEETEINDLLKINIGVMPLEHDAWSEGKCGFKIIQYFSLGIPAVASPVGVNNIIVEEGESGFLCTSFQEWYDALALLIKDEIKRKEFGQQGRKKIEQAYSIKANSDKFLSLFS
jgi:glycosyltransferase involved in cell wall biosynthesis